MNENVPGVTVSFNAASRTLTRYCAAPAAGSPVFGVFGLSIGTGIETTFDDSVNSKQLAPQLGPYATVGVVVTPFSTRRITSVSPDPSALDSVTRIVGVGSFVLPPAAMPLPAGVATPKAGSVVEFGATELNAVKEKVCAGAMLSTVNA